MLLSKACIYGIRASLYMAAMHEQERHFVPIREVSGKLDLSFHFLTKILQQLTAAGLMESYKGPKVGIALSKSPEDIMLVEVVGAIDGLGLFTECVLGLPGCGDKKPCPLHDKWAYTREAIKIMFETTSLGEMASKGRRMNLRLAEDISLDDLMKLK
ncbi:MAG: RrF2 family transcriptional regulator [Cyclonatronaceae bacterium]